MSTLSIHLSKSLFYNDDEAKKDEKNAVENVPKTGPFYLGASMSEIGHIAITSSKTSLRHTPGSRKESVNLINTRDSGYQTSVIDADKEPIQLKGSVYAILSAFGFCASNVVMKKSIHLSATDHSLVRYLLSLVIFIIICRFNDLKFLGPRKQFKLLCARGIIGTCSLLSFYISIMLLDPSDSTTLVHSAIIITAILSRLFLGEKLTIAHLIATLFTANGVLFISKPEFLFPKEPGMVLSTNTSQTIEKKSSFESMKPILGLFFASISATCSSITFFTLKKLSIRKVHWATCSIYVCWVGIPASLILSICFTAFGGYHTNPTSELPDLPMDLFYSFVSSLFSTCGQIFMAKALIYEDATKVAILKTSDVFIACILQYFFLGIVMDYLAIIGSVSIVLSTITILVFKIMVSRYEDYKQNRIESSGSTEELKENCCFKMIFFKI